MRFSTKNIATKNRLTNTINPLSYYAQNKQAQFYKEESGLFTKNQGKINNELLCVILSMFLIIFGFDALSNSLLLNEKNFKVTSTPMIRLKMSGLPNYLDETVIYYQSGATDGFDSNFDAYKLLGPNPAPHISQEFSSTLFAINGIEPLAQTFPVNIKATIHVTGNFTITATDFGDGIGNSLDFEPTYSYSIPGLYKTKLIGMSSTGCIDSTHKYLNAIALATYIKVKSEQNITLTDIGNNQFKIKSGKYFIEALFIDLVDLAGKTILKQRCNLNRSEGMLLDLNDFNAGMYVLSICNNDNVLMNSKILIK